MNKIVTLVFVSCLSSVINARLPPIHPVGPILPGESIRTSNDVPCTNIPPGFGQFRLGVDVTVLDLLPGMVKQDLGFRNALFDFTCNKGTMWDFNNNGTAGKYQLPDQLGSAYIVSRQYLNYASTNFLAYHDYKTAAANAAKIDKNFTLGAFASSQSYLTMQDAQQQTQSYAIHTQSLASGMVGQMQPYWFVETGAAFKQFVDTVLPDHYDDDPQAYATLIKIFGTHYITRGELSGIFSSRYSYSKAYRMLAGDASVVANAAISFQLLLGELGVPVPKTKVVDPAFVAASTFQEIYYGGVSTLIDAKNFNGWWNSIPSTPWPVGVELNPIWQLVKNNTKKQESVRHATLSYVDAAYLRDKVRALTTFLRRSPRSHDYAQALLNDVNKLIAVASTGSLLDHEQVVRVGENVSTFLQPLSSVDDVLQHSSLQINTDWNGIYQAGYGAGVAIPDACGQTFMQFSINFPQTATNNGILDKIFMLHTYQMATLPTPSITVARGSNGQWTLPRVNHCLVPRYDASGTAFVQNATWSLQMPYDVPGYLTNVQFCVTGAYLAPPFVKRTSVVSCVMPNQDTTPVPIVFVWTERVPSMTWTFQLKFDDLGPY